MEIVTLPRLGQTMESGVVTLWHVEVGDSFTEGSPLYEIETEKITSDVEARMDGVLLRVLVGDGDEVPVGSPLALVAAPGEDPSDSDIASFLTDAGTGGVAEEAMSASQEPPTEVPAPVDAVQDGPAQPSEILAVPKAREIARRRGIELAGIAGSGVDGVIRVVDVLSSGNEPEPTSPAPSAVSPSAALAAPAFGPTGNTDSTDIASRVPLRGIRKAMSEALSASWPQVPQFTQQVTVDATALKARLARLKYEGAAVSYNDLIVAAVAQLALDHPDVNAALHDNEILYFTGVNVSVAVATDDGLVVPVVHDAHRLSVAQIAARTKDLAERGRSRNLNASDMVGGTITVSNLGAMGVENGTAIVNSPQSAIVFVGAVRDVPVVEGGEVVARAQLGLSVSFDHRVVDGMTAAKFTVGLKERLENGG